MISFISSLLSFILVFAIVVIVHEFGHFWVARRMGVKVLRFSIGFGPILWKRTDKLGTEFAVAAIPLGGYVKMVDGREGELTAEEKPFAFDQKPVSKRIAIVIAGPLFNFLFAIVAYMVILMIGIVKVAPIVGDVAPDSPAAHAGIQAGDEFISIANQATADWQSVYLAILKNAGEVGTTEVAVRAFVNDAANQPLREYQLPNITLKSETPGQDPLAEWGVTLGLPHIPAIIGTVVPNEPAAQAGLQTNDEVTEVDGQAIHDWYALAEHIRSSPGKPLKFTVKRQAELVHITVTPKATHLEGQTQSGPVGIIGVTLAPLNWPPELLRTQREWPVGAFTQSVINTWDLSKLTFVIMGKMLTGTVGIDNLSGPISIAQGADTSVENGWLAFISFLILLSVNLGVINLLPIPMLDGGHLLYYVIELVRGRPVSEAAQRVGLFIGLAFVILLMSVGLHNDILGLLK
jgi:regulator of sigma E protease